MVLTRNNNIDLIKLYASIAQQCEKRQQFYEYYIL